MDIRLGPIEAIDLAQIRDWRNDDRLRHSFREYRLLNLIDQRDWFDHISRSHKVEMFSILASRVPIGICGLCNINWVNRTAEVSYYINPDCQREDAGLQALELLRQKAFNELNLRRLWAETYAFCTERIGLLEQCGYICEGVMRKHVFKLGKYHDSMIHGLVNDECTSNCHGR